VPNTDTQYRAEDKEDEPRQKFQVKCDE